MFNRAMSKILDLRYVWLTRTHARYRRDVIHDALEWRWEKFWLCRVRNKHRVKFRSDGRCVRCGR